LTTLATSRTQSAVMVLPTQNATGGEPEVWSESSVSEDDSRRVHIISKFSSRFLET
jgi:hypothetical protein